VFLSLQWREINIWPEREIVDYHSPSDLKRQFPKTRVIFDGTECPIKKPKATAVQQVTFSSYKNCNTAKVLVGVTPGVICVASIWWINQQSSDCREK